jgi:hypothetical protein
VSSRKRHLDKDNKLDNWPKAKRRAFKAVASLTSSSVSTQKSSQEDPIDSQKDPMDTREDPDNFGRRRSKRPANESQSYFNHESRMILCMTLQSCKTWGSCYKTLNIALKNNLVALVINDLPQ